MKLWQFLRLADEHARPLRHEVPARWWREYQHWQTWAAFRGGLEPYVGRQARACARLGPARFWSRLEKRRAAFSARITALTLEDA